MDAPAGGALSATESATLSTLESAIESGLESFVEVGNCLARIRDGRLYRATHDTFAEYIVGRWKFSTAHAYRLMNLNEVVEDLSPIGEKPNEAQARELGRAPKEDRVAVWQEAKGATDGVPTAKAVREAVERRKVDTAETSRPRESTSYEEPDDDALEQAQVDHDSAELHRQLFISLKSRWANWNHGDGAFFVVVAKVVAQAKKELKS